MIKENLNCLAFEEALRLALYLHEKFYKNISPNFELCDSTAGIISQIDNMVCTLVKAQPKREPLSDEEAHVLCQNRTLLGGTVLDLLRDVEKAHKIGVDDE